MKRRKFITNTMATVALASLPIAATTLTYHPLYLKYAKQLGFTFSEMGYKTIVLLKSDDISPVWLPIRFDDLHKGDIFRTVNTDGPVKGLLRPIGEWKALDEPFMLPNEHEDTVLTITCDEVKVDKTVQDR